MSKFLIIFTSAFFLSFPVFAETLGKQIVSNPEKIDKAFSVEVYNRSPYESFTKNIDHELSMMVQVFSEDNDYPHEKIRELFSDPDMILLLCDNSCSIVSKYLTDKPFLKMVYKKKLNKLLKLYALIQDKELQKIVEEFLLWEELYITKKKGSNNYAAVSHRRWDIFISDKKLKPSIKNGSDALFAYRHFIKDSDKWLKVFKGLSNALK